MRRTALLTVVLAGMAGCSPTPAPTSTIEGSNYIVFFTPWSADLDPPALSIVASAARAAQAAPGKPVLVEGYADAVGSPDANFTLSKLRAQHLADMLVQDGVARERIVLRSRGATRDTSTQESRRVVIEIGQ